LKGRASGFCLKKTRAGLVLGLTADGAQHRWSKIVQVGQRTVKTEVFGELCRMMTFFGGRSSFLWKRTAEIWQQKAVPGGTQGTAFILRL
jgi:hypothetical protein